MLQLAQTSGTRPPSQERAHGNLHAIRSSESRPSKPEVCATKLPQLRWLFERQIHDLFHRLYIVDFHVANLLALQVFTHVDLVLERHNHFAHTAPLGGQHFFLDAANRQYLTMARFGRTRRSVSMESSAAPIVMPADGPSFGIAPAGT